ncbi:hypothetical protein J2S17_003438 [Cytobacillus purgationiresistens]|uniref:Uncharacterized protein n=1 Tax=Cytobacillus purgationiresistens TaxID=863449 RepID=A0ABU0ANB3_9BACI|nr:hypothetical protein [Cytobacillus purgationiresistens]
MLLKICFRCNRPSYSSSEMKGWNCPYCQTNLDHFPNFPTRMLEKCPNRKGYELKGDHLIQSKSPIIQKSI